MRGSESGCREDDSCRYVLSQRDKLALQISPKQGLFAESGGNGKHDPHPSFGVALRHQILRGVPVRVFTQNGSEGHGRDEEQNSYAQMLKGMTGRTPAIADHRENRRAVKIYPQDHQPEHQPFKENGPSVYLNSIDAPVL